MVHGLMHTNTNTHVHTRAHSTVMLLVLYIFKIIFFSSVDITCIFSCAIEYLCARTHLSIVSNSLYSFGSVVVNIIIVFGFLCIDSNDNAATQYSARTNASSIQTCVNSENVLYYVNACSGIVLYSGQWTTRISRPLFVFIQPV